MIFFNTTPSVFRILYQSAIEFNFRKKVEGWWIFIAPCFNQPINNMWSFIHSEFFTTLLIVNGVLIVCFLWLHHNYYELLNKLEEYSVTSRYLDERQRRILQRYFPFYKKLSPNLKRIFEQKLLYFYNMKQYDSGDGISIHYRMKLFVSAYAAQVSLGFKSFGFSHIHHIRIYTNAFYSVKRKKIVSWELDEEGILHLSWKDFFEQLKKEVVLPMGLEIMAHVIRKDNNHITNEIFSSRSLLYPQLSITEVGIKGPALFKDEDFCSKEEFMEACLKNYFGYTLEMKNSCPDLFKKVDQLLYSEINLAR